MTEKWELLLQIQSERRCTVINSIIWRGISSAGINGLLIQELPPITKPPMRYNETVVDGKDGSIIEELGYSSYEKSVSIGLYGNYDINAVISYFCGEGNLILSNEPDYYYKAKIVSQIDFNRLVRFRTATVKFKVQPYKYSTETAQTIGDSGTVINSGNVISKPIITISGSGTVEFKIGGVTIFSYTFPNDETSVTIDCEKEDAYNGAYLRNRNMTGEFPALSVGNNLITTSGIVNSITFENRSRWI